ncbi:MAG: LETM1-related biofilm-associated protein [Bacteroidota bacterium]
MNPSAHGWIKKLLKEISEHSVFQSDGTDFYASLKTAGFIYGSNIAVIDNVIVNNDLTEEERSKVNLLLAFYYIHKSEQSTDYFVESVIDFYKTIEEYKRSIFAELFGGKKTDSLLENIIHKRIHVDDNFITKNFNYFLINALLFIDILGYKMFLKAPDKAKSYVNNFEAALETIVFKVLNSKQDKTKYDDNLIRLFEMSLRHKHEMAVSYDDLVTTIKNPLEKLYIIDMVCMASWSDTHIDKEEYEYLSQLRTDLDLNTETLISSIDDINTFYKTHKSKIAFLSSKNLAQSFYDNSSKMVSKLIKRNSKRLLKELSQSKEAMMLLTQSTQRNLTDAEQKKIQEQLLDIFKSIPSLAIFMLPGGMILLPLFVKFIPKLLPSAFDDNRIQE